MTFSRLAGSSGARRTRCSRCHRPVLRQLVGQRAALDVTADDDRMPLGAATALREDNRLDWCLRTTAGGLDLRWSSTSHPADCPHPHVIDHQCTAPPNPARQQRRTRQTAVPDGQLTL